MGPHQSPPAGGRDLSHEDVLPALEDEIAAFWRQARVSARDAARALHPRLDPTAFPMIAVLAGTGPLRVSELGAKLFLDKSTIIDRTTTLATIGSIAVGVALFGGAVFLGQYFQIARGYSPTAAGLLTLPMILGSTVSSTVSGQLISRFGRWKAFLVGGSVLMLVGFALLATIDHRTDIVLMGSYLLVLGVGLGMTMQNMVLAVQNSVRLTDLGAASATVTFFRSLGGTIGVSVLGAMLATQVADLIVRAITASGVAVPAGAGTADVGIGSLAQLPPELAAIVRAAYGDATAHIFLIAAILSVVTLVTVALIREVPLRTRVGDDPAPAAARA